MSRNILRPNDYGKILIEQSTRVLDMGAILGGPLHRVV